MLYTLIALLAVWMVEASTAISPNITLNDGYTMPLVSYGTFVRLNQINDTKAAVLDAINQGFRSIDTALLYQTESQIGEAVKEAIASGNVTRDELYIITKFDLGYTKEYVIKSLNQSLQNLQMDYVDLYLVHLAYNPLDNVDFDELSIWEGMIEVQKMGLAKSIGVSNYNSTHINRIITYTGVVPAVNQIEVHPAYANLELTAYCQSLGITVMGFAVHGFMVPRPYTNATGPPSFNDTTLVNIGNKYGISTNLVVLCYLINRNISPVITSYTPAHTTDSAKALTSCPTFTKNETYIINEFNSNSKAHDLTSYATVNDFVMYYYNQTVNEAFASLYIN